MISERGHIYAIEVLLREVFVLQREDGNNIGLAIEYEANEGLVSEDRNFD